MSVESGPGPTHQDIAPPTERTEPETAQEIMDYLHGYVTSDPGKTRAQNGDIFTDVAGGAAQVEFGDKSIVTAVINDRLAVSVEAFAIDPDLQAHMSVLDEPSPKVGLRLTLHTPNGDPSYTSPKPNPQGTISRAYIDIGDQTADLLGRSSEGPSYQLKHYPVVGGLSEQIVQPSRLVPEHPILSIFAHSESLVNVLLFPNLQLEHLKAVKDIFAAQPKPTPTPRQ